MRFALAACAVLAAACGTPSSADGHATLSDIISNPLAFDGIDFEGVVYVFRAAGYYEFYPTAVVTDVEREAFGVTALAADHRGLDNLETGDRVRLRATIEVPEACFSPDPDNACSPWPHPVYFHNIRVLERE